MEQKDLSKKTDYDFPIIPENYKELPRHDQAELERSVIAALDEPIKNALSVAKNNLLESAERKSRGFKYIDKLDDMIDVIGPQILEYCKDDAQEEVEFSEHLNGENAKGGFVTDRIKTIHGTIRRKDLLVERFGRILEKRSKVVHELGQMPDMPGGGGPLIHVEANVYKPEEDSELKRFKKAKKAD